MLLLDIYRGTNTQEQIGTRITDLQYLIKIECIKIKGNSTGKFLDDYHLSRFGSILVKEIKQKIKRMINE